MASPSPRIVRELVAVLSDAEARRIATHLAPSSAIGDFIRTGRITDVLLTAADAAAAAVDSTPGAAPTTAAQAFVGYIRQHGARDAIAGWPR